MKLLKKVVIVFLLVLVSIAIVIIGNGYDIYKNVVKEEPLYEKVQSIRKKDSYAKIDEVPQMYINAVISVEDHRFYEHKGIDIIAIGRAFVNDIKKRDFVEGGSTITEQLAKNMYFTQEKKISRKVAEAFVSFDIEKNFDKDDILELYINTSYYGDGYYTVKEASRGYFNKEPQDMTDYECTLLAGIPNAPSVYSPTKNPQLAKQRQKQVLDKMVKYKYLTKSQADKILNY